MPEFSPGVCRRCRDWPTSSAARTALADVEAEHIRKFLASVNNHRGKASALLGISPSTFWRMLKSQPGAGSPAADNS